MNRRFYFKIFFALFTLSLVSACSQAETITPTTSPTVTPKWSTPIITSWSTPVITATPILDGMTEEDIQQFIYQYFKTRPDCRLDILGSKADYIEKPTLTFLALSNPFPGDIYELWEIADSSSGMTRAYVACEKKLCQAKIILENLENGSLSELDWSGRIPYRPISRVIWLGDDLLMFSHNTSPNDVIIAVVQVKEQKFLYYWLASYPCP